MTEIEIKINKYAQGEFTDSEIMHWFDQFDLCVQKEIRDSLIMCMQQAHPTDEIIGKAIKTARIKETMTAAVIFKNKPFKIAVNKMVCLPDSEMRTSFTLMLEIFKMADTHRRETECKNGCRHEWHHIL